LVAIVLVSGCISSDLHNADLADISKNPENYLNKDVKVNGKLDQLVHIRQPTIEWDYVFVDSQGYKFPIKLPQENRDFYVGQNYELSGTIKNINYCYCERRFVDVDGNFVSYNIYKYIQYTASIITNFTCDKQITMYSLFGTVDGNWTKTSESDTKVEEPSCTSNGGTVYTCSYNYNSALYTDSFKDEYRCNPDSKEIFYYIEANKMTKI
jgi:hypothetical protein